MSSSPHGPAADRLATLGNFAPMYTNNTKVSLQEVLQLVPILSLEALNLKNGDIWGDRSIESSSSNKVRELDNCYIVVNADHQPLGLFRSQQWREHLLLNDNRYQGLINQTENKLLPLEPLTVMIYRGDLGELWQQVQGELADFQQSTWVLVDGIGKYLGVVEPWQLLQYLAPQLHFSSQEESAPKNSTKRSPKGTTKDTPKSSPKSSPKGSKNISQNIPNIPKSVSVRNTQVGIEEGFLEHISESIPEPISESISESISVSSPYYGDLVRLLEQLPLPLMLQTEDGQVISQNVTWRQQINCSLLMRTDLSFSEDHFSLNLLNQRVSIQGEPEFDRRKSSPENPENPENLESPENPKDTHDPRLFRLKTPNRVWQLVKFPLEIQQSPASSHLWLILATDITEQQQVARELAAKNLDLVQLNRLKDEFLACISHELKTPLTAVLGLSSLLKEQSLGELNDRQSRYVHMIHQSGRQLMLVVNDILDLTRIETEQVELVLEPVSIASVCDRAYSQAQQRILPHQNKEEELSPEHQFTLKIDPDLEIVIADELRLRQILSHLLSNALKFTEPGASLGLNVNQWSGWTAFTVWDTGIGIPLDKQHLIFQKFQQLESPLTRRFDGTGLGLVLAQRLARLHGGDISFISQPGRGSQFTLLLPSENLPEDLSPQLSKNFPQDLDQDLSQNLVETLSEELFQNSRISLSPNTQSPNSQSSNSQSSSNNSVQARTTKKSLRSSNLILVIEPVPQYVENLSFNLEALGYRVVIARCGTEALEKARHLKPCLCFLNPLLPLLSGWDVLVLLKSDAQTQHLPILITTTQSEKQEAYAHQADGFLSLPVDQDVLRQCLNRILQGEPQHPEDDRPISITILILSLQASPASNQSPDFSCLSNLLNQAIRQDPKGIKCRILEVNDLEQAELLTQVWHPDVLLLNGQDVAELTPCLQELASHHSLAHLPLITLDQDITEAASKLGNLSVFPCLAADSCLFDSELSACHSLLQVIEMAIFSHYGKSF